MAQLNTHLNPEQIADIAKDITVAIISNIDFTKSDEPLTLDTISQMAGLAYGNVLARVAQAQL